MLVLGTSLSDIVFVQSQVVSCIYKISLLIFYSVLFLESQAVSYISARIWHITFDILLFWNHRG
jgi:hypothetical protein